MKNKVVHISSKDMGKIKKGFIINYRIISNEFDDFVGQHGFFQVDFNGFLYGEMYPKEIESIMDKASLYDWFERFVRVAKILMFQNYVLLSDIESYNTWIEFKRNEDKLTVSIVKAQKPQNSRDIEFNLEDVLKGEWANQTVSFEQFKKEISSKGKEYVKVIRKLNPQNMLIDELELKIKELK